MIYYNVEQKHHVFNVFKKRDFSEDSIERVHASSFQRFEKQLKCKDLFKIIEKPPFGKSDIHLTSQLELNVCPNSILNS